MSERCFKLHFYVLISRHSCCQILIFFLCVSIKYSASSWQVWKKISVTMWESCFWFFFLKKSFGWLSCACFWKYLFLHSKSSPRNQQAWGAGTPEIAQSVTSLPHKLDELCLIPSTRVNNSVWNQRQTDLWPGAHWPGCLTYPTISRTIQRYCINKQSS